MNEQDMIKFEDSIVKAYEEGKIKAPVHMSGGNEEALLKIFKNVKKEDWVLSTWRSHYHALLKSKDPKWLKSEILAGRSIHINSKKHKIFTSAIVGGIPPIAVGMALAQKLKKKKGKTWCFIGDMTFEMGITIESAKYASYHDLPVMFVVEDNKMGCYSPTKKVWGKDNDLKKNVMIYNYVRKYPHHGIGKWIEFNETKHNGVVF